jgi:hypothetical protein
MRDIGVTYSIHNGNKINFIFFQKNRSSDNIKQNKNKNWSSTHLPKFFFYMPMIFFIDHLSVLASFFNREHAIVKY